MIKVIILLFFVFYPDLFPLQENAKHKNEVTFIVQDMDSKERLPLFGILFYDKLNLEWFPVSCKEKFGVRICDCDEIIYSSICKIWALDYEMRYIDFDYSTLNGEDTIVVNLKKKSGIQY